MIYVIGEQRTGVVKIGTAGDPWERLVELQSGNPRRLAVQVALPGNQPEESHLHRVFAERRVGGEWFDFHNDDAVAAVVAAAATVPASKRPAPRKPRRSLARTRKGPPPRDPEATRTVVRAAFTASGYPRLPTARLLAYLAEHAPDAGWADMPPRSAAIALASDLYAVAPSCRPAKFWDPDTKTPVQGYALADVM